MTQSKAPGDAALVRLGAEVRTLRERADKHAAELAAELGISCRTLYRVERGECRVSNRVYYKISEALGVDVQPVLRKVAA